MAARRRTRRMFLVTAPDGSEKQINVLCYSDEFTFRYLESAGYTNIDKVKRTKPRVAASDATWRKDERAIQQAIDLLGLKRPVVVKLTGHVGGRLGGYKPSPDATEHRITVKNYIDPRRAGEAVWHELGHAMQFEREVGNLTGRSAILAWNASPIHRGSYYNRPCEVEARRFERYNETRPLALDKRSKV